jgi:hypothetical protein
VLSNTNAACVQLLLALCLQRKQSPLGQRMVQMNAMHTRMVFERLEAE